MQAENKIPARPLCDCFVYHIAAQTERVGIQLVFSEKSEKALIRTRTPAGTWWRTRDRVSFSGHSHRRLQVLWLDKKDKGAGHHMAIHLRRNTTAYTHIHTQIFTYQRNLSNPSPSGLPSIFVTKATTEWHFIPLLLVSLPPPLLSLRWGKINCKLPGWANRDMGRRREWLGNWNELEWKKRLLEWEDLDPQCSFDPSEVFFVD